MGLLNSSCQTASHTFVLLALTASVQRGGCRWPNVMCAVPNLTLGLCWVINWKIRAAAAASDPPFLLSEPRPCIFHLVTQFFLLLL